jgi:hypothetical protein
MLQPRHLLTTPLIRRSRLAGSSTTRMAPPSAQLSCGRKPGYQPDSAMVFWRYCNLRIIIGRRAFLERALKSSTSALVNEADAQSASICLEGALDSIRAINQFCSVHLANRLEKWYEL